MGLLVFGDGPIYLILQFATAAILTLAANTAYADFPRLSSIIAQRQVPAAPAREPGRPAGVLERRAGARRRRRRSSSSRSAASPTALIPLYAVGVFTSFTLSPGGHGAPPPEGARAALEVQRVAQRRRVGDHLRHAARRRDHEVHERRVGPDRGDPVHHPVVQVDPHALHDDREGPRDRRRTTGRAR